MVSMKNMIWMEKYRPHSLVELVLDPETRLLLDKFVQQREVPHLLLTGSVGSGKTTTAKILLASVDCDSITLNASDERGIDTIRDKVKMFAMSSSIRTWKVVFLDEADMLTFEAQTSLRNLMESYADQTRFILTCNYLNKIIEPIRSRCQVIEFRNLSRKEIIKLLELILATEEVAYDIDDLIELVNLYSPDIRSMINNLNLNSIDGAWHIKGTERFRNLEALLDLIKKGDIPGIRELSLDYTEAYRYLFDKVDDLTDDYAKRVNLSVEIADYLWRETFIADKGINFAACCLKLVRILNGTE
jgi:replication factor C small subunit